MTEYHPKAQPQSSHVKYLSDQEDLLRHSQSYKFRNTLPTALWKQIWWAENQVWRFQLDAQLSTHAIPLHSRRSACRIDSQGPRNQCLDHDCTRNRSSTRMLRHCVPSTCVGFYKTTHSPNHNRSIAPFYLPGMSAAFPVFPYLPDW